MTLMPVVYGAPYSVYVRAVRLALEEKGVAYRLDPIDVFVENGPPASLLERQPFGRIPAFEHDGFRLYEAGAIERYVDEAFPGPALHPSAPRERALFNQLTSILDYYYSRTQVWDIYVERVSAPKQGRAPDEARIQAALPKAQLCLRAISDLMDGSPYLAGEALTLADLHAAPIFAYFTLASEAEALLAERPAIKAWWASMVRRPAMQATAFPA
jgi:glutathione S-transferase